MHIVFANMKTQCIFVENFKTTTMEKQMIQTVIDRANELRKNIEVQKYMMTFKKNEDAENWLVKAAIATLIGINN